MNIDMKLNPHEYRQLISHSTLNDRQIESFYFYNRSHIENKLKVSDPH